MNSVLPVVLFGVVAAALAVATRNSLTGRAPVWAWRLSAVPLWAGVLSLVAFIASDTTVDADGVVHEWFAFLAIAWILFIVGMIGVLIAGVLSLRHRSRG